MKFIDISGIKYGRLLVESFNGRKNSQSYWNCVCDCGNNCVINGAKIKNGHTKSCGCLLKEERGKKSITHGRSHTPEHNVWMAMKSRCYNQKNKSYTDYGERGVIMCERWLGKDGFINFLYDMGERPSNKHEIEREDNNGIYDPQNCSWQLRKKQANNKRSNRVIEFNGESKTMAQWAEKFGISGHTIGKRLKRGWPVDRAIKTASLKNSKSAWNKGISSVIKSNFISHSFGHIKTA